ncbi:MAG: hypothetical protein AAFX05_06215 [Planctomycetota bacterium]
MSHVRWCIMFLVMAALLGCDARGPSSMGGERVELSDEQEGVRYLLTAPAAVQAVGDVELTIEATSADGALTAIGIDVAETVDWLADDIRPADAEPDASGAAIASARIVLAPLATGSVQLPEITVTPRLGETDGTPVVLQTLAIEVTPELTPDDTELAALKSIVEPPAVFPWWLLLVVGGVVLIGAIVAAITWKVRRREKQERIIRRSAHEVALEALDALQAKDLVGRGRIKQYYLEASLILRRYIEDRFTLHAPERTTEEFLQEARLDVALTAQDLEVLERFLEHCDLVKFARMPVTPEQAGRTADTMRDFIERTRVETAEVAFREDGQRVRSEVAA